MHLFRYQKIFQKVISDLSQTLTDVNIGGYHLTESLRNKYNII